MGMIERAHADGGGKLLVGGGIPGGDLANGFYVEPTLFGDVDPACEIAQVEVFGPVSPCCGSGRTRRRSPSPTGPPRARLLRLDQ